MCLLETEVQSQRIDAAHATALRAHALTNRASSARAFTSAPPEQLEAHRLLQELDQHLLHYYLSIRATFDIQCVSLMESNIARAHDRPRSTSTPARTFIPAPARPVDSLGRPRTRRRHLMWDGPREGKPMG